MWFLTSFFKNAAKILAVLLILFLIVQLLPYLYPIIDAIFLFFSPVILGVVLYYMFRPLVAKLISMKVPFYGAIAVVFLILGAVVGITAFFLGSVLLPPIQEVAAAPSKKIEEVKQATFGFMHLFNLNLISYPEIRQLVINYVTNIQKFILENTFTIISAVTKFAFLFVMTPFSLFYFLKDDYKFHKWFIETIPMTYRSRVENMLENIDQTLLTFFNGQITVALSVTSLAFVGLLIIWIDNLSFLTFLTFFLALIPYLGTFLAIIPPVLMGLTASYWMALAAGIVMICVHLIEANIITPQVMMKRFDIHPLTVILLVVMSFTLFGITGPLWITPVYVFVREIALQLIDFLKMQEKE